MRLAAIVMMGICGAVWTLLAGCAAGRGSAAVAAVESEQRFEFSRVCMGVRTVVTVYAPDREAAVEDAAAAFARIGELDACMSDYRPQSELMRLCAAGAGTPVEVSADPFEVLRESEAIARASDGAFDITVGPAVRLWRETRRTGKMPAPEELQRARELIGWQKVRLNAGNRTVTLLREGMRLDLGGIAKGVAAECAVETLKMRGRKRCLVALEGDIAAGDAPPGETGWRIGIAGMEGAQSEIMLTNGSVSTAGDEGQFVEIEGTRYSHIIDPRTGLGMGTRRSVTVVSFGRGAGARADGLDTPCYILGAERGAGMIGEFPSTAAMVREEESGRVVVIDPERVLRGRWVGVVR